MKSFNNSVNEEFTYFKSVGARCGNVMGKCGGVVEMRSENGSKKVYRRDPKSVPKGAPKGLPKGNRNRSREGTKIDPEMCVKRYVKNIFHSAWKTCETSQNVNVKNYVENLWKIL